MFVHYSSFVANVRRIAKPFTIVAPRYQRLVGAIASLRFADRHEVLVHCASRAEQTLVARALRASKLFRIETGERSFTVLVSDRS